MEVIKSEDLKKFSGFINMFKSMYDEASTNVNELDKLTQDYLHKLELQETSYTERAKIATAIRSVRKDRRYWKDIVECFQPMADILAVQEQRKTVSNLANALGTANLKLRSLKARSYRPKVMPEVQYHFSTPTPKKVKNEVVEK